MRPNPPRAVRPARIADPPIRSPAGAWTAPHGIARRPCRSAWATIARILGGSEDIIAVIEEAQFLGRRILFYRDRTNASITVRVPDAIDGFEDINLHNANGYAVLEALGLPTDSCGEIDISELRDRLADPKAKRCFINAGIARRFGFFEAVAALDDTHDSARLVWS